MRKKHGEQFTQELSEPLDFSAACVFELAEIELYKPRLNKRLISSPGNIGQKMPASVGLAVSARQRGKVISPEQRQLLREALTGRPQRPEWIAKRFAARAGYKHSEATKDKLRVAHVGLHPSAATRAKMSKAHKGRKNSKASIQRMSEAASKRWDRQHLLQYGWGHPWRLASLNEASRSLVEQY